MIDPGELIGRHGAPLARRPDLGRVFVEACRDLGGIGVIVEATPDKIRRCMLSSDTGHLKILPVRSRSKKLAAEHESVKL